MTEWRAYIQELRNQLSAAIALLADRDRRGMETETSQRVIAEARELLARPMPQKREGQG